MAVKSLLDQFCLDRTHMPLLVSKIFSIYFAVKERNATVLALPLVFETWYSKYRCRLYLFFPQDGLLLAIQQLEIFVLVVFRICILHYISVNDIIE